LDGTLENIYIKALYGANSAEWFTNCRSTGKRALPRKCTYSVLPRNSSRIAALAAKERVMKLSLEQANRQVLIRCYRRPYKSESLQRTAG